MSERTADHPVLPLFLERWSPRAFDPRPIDDDSLMSLFEAARWAPSAFNVQPWRFAYAKRDDAGWSDFLGALIPFNRSWAQNASALIYILSDTKTDRNGERVPSHSHSFDAGAAWMALALQATSMGLIVHAMSGVDFDAARRVVNAPEDFRVEAAVAIGYRGDKASLPESLQQREIESGRRPLSETVFRGSMGD